MSEELGTQSVEIVEIEITTKDKTVTQDSSRTLNKKNRAEQIIIMGTEQHPATGNRGRDILVYWDVPYFGRIPVNSVMKFAMQTIRHVRLNPEQNWTVIMCVGTNAYTYNQMQEIEKALLSIKNDEGENSVQNILRCNKPDSILKYINDGIHKGANVHTYREKTKIRSIDVYCHGVVFEFALWMELYTDPHPFNVGYAKAMNRNSFLEGDTIISSFACRTGIGNPKINKSVYYVEKVSTGWFSSTIVQKKHDLMMDKSLAQALSNASGGTTYAWLKRSSYGETFNTQDELDFMDAYEAHVYGEKSERSSGYLATFKTNGVSEEDQKRYEELKAIRDRRYIVDGQTFDPEGALHPVTDGDSPLGLDGGMKKFTPKI